MWQWLAALLGLGVSAAVARRWVHRRRAGPRRAAPRRLTRLLLAPERLARQVPLEPGTRVLLLGPVALEWLRLVARVVGRYGKVYLVELDPARAAQRQAELRAEGIFGVEVLGLDGARLDLPDSAVDLALCVGSLAEAPRRARLLWELQRTLRPGGHLTVMEGLHGPRYLSAASVKHDALGVGLRVRNQRGAPWAYILNLQKA